MKNYRVVRSARTDMQEIWNYIAEENIPAATALIARFGRTFEVIGADPGVGHTRSDLTTLEVLFMPVGAYLIVYRPVTPGVEVLAVLHGARDVRALLRLRLNR